MRKRFDQVPRRSKAANGSTPVSILVRLTLSQLEELNQLSEQNGVARAEVMRSLLEAA